VIILNKLHSKTYPEISSQPEALVAALKQLEQQRDWVTKYLTGTDFDEIIFIGSGSSFYQAQTMASVYHKWTGRRASAYPSSEIFLFREHLTNAKQRYLLVGVSRSGESSEVILALESVLPLSHWSTCGITCYEDSRMAQITPCLVSPLGSEQSTVMTKSFSSMTFMMLAAIASSINDQQLMKQLTDAARIDFDTVKRADVFIEKFVGEHSFNKYIYLGMGPFCGLVNEANLKIKEMSYVWTESYGTLEFRHGPKSIVDPGTLVCLMVSEHARAYELKVAQEMKDYGATILLVTARQGKDTDFADAVFETGGSELSDEARCVLYLPAVQYLGYYTAVKNGVNPDCPRNLTQVVII
jgi:glucosamine--fructose-6-phosphate aminotransferase (isomerizing)